MDNLPLQPYDFCMLAVLVLTTIFGAWKGMAWQLASLASVAVSSVVAVRFGDRLLPYFPQQMPWNRFVAMFVLYVATSLAIWLLFRVVAGFLDRVKLREFDRQMGAVFGLVKGVLLCLVITFFAVTLSEPARQAVLKAHSGKYIAKLIQRANPVIPEEVRGVLGKYIEELDHKLDPNTPADPTKQPPSLPSGLPGTLPVSARRDTPLSDVQQGFGSGRLNPEWAPNLGC